MVSKLRGYLGYLKGFPWPMMPVALGSLASSKLKGDAAKEADARVLIEMMRQGADFFCCLIWGFRGFHAVTRPYTPAQYFKLEDQDFPQTQAAELVLDGLRLQYGVGDFDAPERRMSLRYRALYWLLRHGPSMQSDHLPLPSVEAYKEMLRDTFGSTFVAYRPIQGDPDAPFVLCRYFTHDFGAPWLRRDGERFVADLSHWESLALKCGGKIYESYGGRLEFDAALKDVSITWKGTRYTPEHPGWPKARYVLVSTALLSVVVEHHTLQIHFLNAALFALKSRTHLTAQHPIRMLLRPFTFRTVTINEHAVHSILTEGGFLFHGSALTWESLKKLYAHAAAEYRHVPVPVELAAKGLLEPSGSAAPGVAFAEEGLLVYASIERFVRAYVKLYYPDDDAVRADATLLGFYREIRAGLPETAGVPAELSRDSLVDLMAVFIWNSTFWHDYTSQTGNSLADYRFGAVIIKRDDVYGSFFPNVQEHLVTLLAHQLTTIEGNKVVDNFHKFWLDDRAVQLALAFQRELWEYRAGLAQRNLQRDFVFNAYDPIFIESSVQT